MPAAPTAAVNTSTTQIATTEFVNAEIINDAVLLAGSTMTGALVLPAATTSIPSVRLPHGTAPSTPTNGDLWTTTAGLYARINGSTLGPIRGQTGSSAGTLSGIPMAFTVERSGVGTAATQMSFGNGTTNVKGARMPYAGKLIAATLHGTTVTGTITVDAYLNGAANTSYRLSGTGSTSDVNVTQDWQASPLSFTAGSTLNWNITTIPTTANGFVVTFFVIYD